MNEQPTLFAIPQQRATSDDYWTPRWIFDALNIEFDLDVACPPEGPLNTPAKAFYTQETDGLTSPWFGTVWMNPPYSNVSPWVKKWINHGDGCALLPVVKETKWVKELWNSEAKSVWINDTKIEFHHKGKMQHIWTIVWLWAIGDKCVQALHQLNIGRIR